MKNLVLFVMRKITRICRDNISAEIFQPSAFSMADGNFLEDFQMVTIDMEKTGKKIKEIRKRSGMTIRQVQEACGISAAAVCKWQNGQAMPTLDNLIILADLWDVKMDDLIVRQVS